MQGIKRKKKEKTGKSREGGGEEKMERMGKNSFWGIYKAKTTLEAWKKHLSLQGRSWCTFTWIETFISPLHRCI